MQTNLLPLAVYALYTVESWLSVRRVLAIDRGSWTLLPLDAALTVVPIVVCFGAVDAPRARRWQIVVAAIAGSVTGVLVSGALNHG